MSQTTLLQYEAPWPVYALDWCKSPSPVQQLRQRSSFRLGIASFTEDYRNRIAVVGLPDERVLVEDDYADFADYPDFVTLVEANHGYPATSLQWQPASAATFSWSKKAPSTEFLATTGDMLRVWEYSPDGPGGSSTYVGRQPSSGTHTLTVRSALSGSKDRSNGVSPPLTSFSWNEQNPSRIVTASIDTTCTVWDINASAAVTQLIAHDREVYDVAWLPSSTDIFVSVGADGSLRAFDLRSLEHSTILYETPTPAPGKPPASPAVGGGGSSTRPLTSPLLRICFHPTDNNYMATFHMGGTDVQILDMRNPGAPVMEMRAHRGQVNAVAFGSGDQPLLATSGDDCQVLLWDMAPHTAAAQAQAHAAPRLSSPRPDVKKRVLTEPSMAYTGQSEITSLAWSPAIPGLPMPTGGTTAPGEWLAIAMGKSIKALKV